MQRTLLAIGFILVATAALADDGRGVQNKTTAVTVTSTPAPCVALNNSRSSLVLDASGASQNIGYCAGASCTPSIGVAGTKTIFAGQTQFYPAGSAPGDALNCVSASGSQPLTVEEGTK